MPSESEIRDFIEKVKKRGMEDIGEEQSEKLAKGELSANELHLAFKITDISSDHRYKIIDFLIKNGFDPGLKSDFGTPLHLAAELGDINIVKLVIDNHKRSPYFNVNEIHSGRTPMDIAMDIAIESGNREVVDYLNKCGAITSVALSYLADFGHHEAANRRPDFSPAGIEPLPRATTPVASLSLDDSLSVDADSSPRSLSSPRSPLSQLFTTPRAYETPRGLPSKKGEAAVEEQSSDHTASLGA